MLLPSPGAWADGRAKVALAAPSELKAPAGAQLAPPAEVFTALRRAGIPAGDVGLIAEPVDGEEPPLYAHNENQPLTLASTTKLVTALAALETLGPDWRWRTRAYLRGPLKDGVLEGDLHIVGGGDARLSSRELAAWFARMQHKGLREIRGNIVLDHFAFRLKPADHAGTPPPSPDHPHHAWPDALTVDEGVLAVELSTGPGGTLQARLVPELDGVELIDQVTHQGNRCQGLRQPAQVTADTKARPMKLVIAGEWASGCPARRVELPMEPGSPFAAAVVAAAWRGAGGRLTGTVEDKAAPDPLPARRARRAPALPKPWSVLESPPLAEVVRDMNKASKNLVARNLMLSLARNFPAQGQPATGATLEDARGRVRQWLLGQGLAEDDIQVDNGSGLSRAEKGRPRALTQLLRNAWNSKLAKVFTDSLPVAGKDGTLASRFKESEAQGRAALKTGTLNDTRALAGYVQGRSGRTYAVTAIVNHAQASRSQAAIDAFIEWVVRNG